MIRAKEVAVERDDWRICVYTCPFCRGEERVACQMHFPAVAKHRCRRCDTLNEVRWREDNLDRATEGMSFDDHVEESKGRHRTSQRGAKPFVMFEKRPEKVTHLGGEREKIAVVDKRIFRSEEDT